MIQTNFFLLSLSCCLSLTTPVNAQGDTSTQASDVQLVSFSTSDDGLVFANLYGTGEHAVVLAHGSRFDKESWSDQAKLLEKKGFRVLAIDFRGYGKSKPGKQGRALYLDVLAAVRYLHDQGAKQVSVIGGSVGGGAAARAAVESRQGEIDRLILIAHVPIEQPQNLKGKILFVVSQGDRLKERVKKQYESAPDPKQLVVLVGDAHAQHIFRSKQADRLTELIVDWLTNDNVDSTSEERGHRP